MDAQVPDRSRLKDQLDDARRKLVETGTRNRLVHVNRGAKRANSLNIINERTTDVFELLRVQGKRMRFSAKGEDDEAEGGERLLPLSTEDERFDDARYRDLVLETPLGPEALERRLLRLFTDARTSEEEQGFNILYLAVGFLKWFESPSSEVVREAPLVLLPVRLVRNEKRATFELSARDDDIVTNLPLQERLRGDFGIELPEIEDSEDWRPDAYLAEVADRVSGKKGWQVDENGMQLGFFSFAKLLMLRDLDPVNWSNGGLEENALVRGLLHEGFEREPPLFAPEDRLDERLDPASIVQVVEADASQTIVIEEVRSGRNLVVQGPPGTGKSQTIANIIAGAVHDGRTVLFVAEKMAALSVVRDRLAKLGLGDLCLELHSRGANKKTFLTELQRTLAQGQAVPHGEDSTGRLREARDALNGIASSLHRTVAGHAFTPFSALSEISRFSGRNVPPPRISADGLEKLDNAARREVAKVVSEYADLVSTTGSRDAHPFRDVGALDLQPTDLQRLSVELDDTLWALASARRGLAEISRKIGAPQVETLPAARRLAAMLSCVSRRPEGAAAAEVLVVHLSDPRLSEAVAAGSAWRAARDEAAPRFRETAWDAPAADIRARLGPGVGSFWARLFGKYRGASAELSALASEPLPRSPQDRLALLDTLLGVQSRRRALGDEEGWLKTVLGPHWRGERTDFASLEAVITWMRDLEATKVRIDGAFLAMATEIAPTASDLSAKVDAFAGGLEERLARIVQRLDLQPREGVRLPAAPLAEVEARLSAMRRDLQRYDEWATLQRLIARLEEAGLDDLVASVDRGDLPADRAADEFLYATAEARWLKARSASPDLEKLRHLDRHDLVARFRALDAARLVETRKLLRSLHAQRLPSGGYGEMGFLRGEMAKKRRHLPIRRVIRDAGSVVQRIKPVFLMSPISVAQFLPPGSVSFDLLVIDEASQVRPEEALGAVARCRQIVVVGDQKQLPPTSFFDRISDGDDVEPDEDDETDEPRVARATQMESILTLCEARGLGDRMLEWHYRSRDPSLITVNNAEFYDHRLILPPSPVQDDPEYGLAFTRVPGVYTSRSRGTGRPGTNRIEAEAVVRRLAEHARKRPDLSVGIVAFSKAQSDMVTEILERARRTDPVLEAMLREDKRENVFVKNIENVQGDERDVILITVGYGPHEPNGRLASMSFGPVNGEGGERRLNVLFSRARVRCEVFCSFDPGDIDVSRTTRVGPGVLKRFLEFAKSGQLHLPEPSGEGGDSPFEEDVAEVVRDLGFPCDAQVGSAGFRIDLGVRHPERSGQYILAVECDGATYHSAIWARERDRLRQEVLEGMGWRFHRIWSTDWFYRRDAEIARLKGALEEARGAEGPHYVGSNPATATAPIEAEVELLTFDPPPDLDEPEMAAPAYVRAEVRAENPSIQPHEAPTARLVELVVRIVGIEGPIHIDEVARRVAAAYGLQRAGSRIQEATERGARSATKAGSLVREGAFLMTEAQKDSPPVRDRSREGSPTNKAEYLPPVEIRAAADMIERESGAVDREEMATAVARLLGFARTGPELRSAILKALAKRP
jgi:hypothetical protein